MEFPATVLWLPDDEEKRQEAHGSLKWYDSRERDPSRSAEFRLYYPAEAEPVVQLALPGDLLVLALMPNGSVLVVLAPTGSTSERQLLWLFGLPTGLDEPATKRLTEADEQLNAMATEVLQAIGIETQEDAPDFLDELLSRFGLNFPTTAEMSAFAREVSHEVSPTSAPDEALVTWFEHEEILFRTLERQIVSVKLGAGFDSVDDFMAFSLSVQNRRKSRAGSALENHVEQLLVANRVRFSRGKITERKSKPDFVFPGVEQYRNATFPATRLSMLAVKSTCKERWRQVLPEADRISEKHLLTLEPGISLPQTDEMRVNRVQLVIPRPRQSSYLPEQRTELMDLEGFLTLVHAREFTDGYRSAV